MTDKSDVVGRLRARADEQERNNSYPVDRALDREAADEIDRLTAALASEREARQKAEDRVKTLEEALEFYADPFNRKDENGEPIWVPDFYSELEFGDRARAVLKETKDGE